jgi:hypothetical protein
MEGPFLAFKGLLLVVLFVFVHRRFETVGARDRIFERVIARDRPLVGAIHAPGRAAAVATALGDALARPILIGSGRRPWPFYAARMVVSVTGDVIELRVASVKALRVGADPPGLVGLLPRDHGEIWLRADLGVDLVDERDAPHGWRIAADGELVPWSGVPGWLAQGTEESLSEAFIRHPRHPGFCRRFLRNFGRHSSPKIPSELRPRGSIGSPPSQGFRSAPQPKSAQSAAINARNAIPTQPLTSKKA